MYTTGKTIHSVKDGQTIYFTIFYTTACKINGSSETIRGWIKSVFGHSNYGLETVS
jgi:hypothetical protein